LSQTSAAKAAGLFASGPHLDISPITQGWQPSTVTAILQSHEGYLWLGTYNGLMRYDGVRFTTFDSGNTRGLQNSRITSLYEDSTGAMWIGHETGELSRFVNGHFEPVPLAEPWPGGTIEAINTDENNDLWLVNASGKLFRLRDGKAAEPPGGGSATRKAVLTRTRTGQLWITANGQVATLERNGPVGFRFNGTEPGDFYEAILPARAAGVWAVINGSLKRLREGRWEMQVNDCPGPQTPVTTLLETRTGTLLMGTLNEGVFVVPAGSTPLHFSRTNGLSHDWVRSLCEDQEGTIWIGTGAGLDTLRVRKVKTLNPPDGWQGRAVLSFAARADGSAWIGTEGAGMYEYLDGKWTVYNESNGLVNLFVWSVLATQRGDLLVGTWGGGLLVKKGNRLEAEGDLSKETAAVISLFEDSHGSLWVGTTTGVHRYENGKRTWSAEKDKLFLPDVRAITEMPDGTIFFGMLGGGLASLKDGKLEQFRKKDGLSSDFVQCLLPDSEGSLWIGTSDNGLARWRRGKFAGIGAEQGLADRNISHLVDDNAGNMWIGSHGGILRVSRLDLNRCADGMATTIHCLTYGKAEGLASETCSGGFQPGACKTEDGLLWFPTTKGLAILDSANVTTNRVEPPVVIEEVLVDGRVVKSESTDRKSGAGGLQSLKIRPGAKRVEIHYTGLSFAAPDKVLFQYKLEGIESEWRKVGTKRYAEYNYLRPGSYTFRVIACNNDEIWNETGASLPFAIEPLFWQTWWFMVGAILTGAVAVGGVVRAVTRRRVHVRLEQLERQQAIERERARIARDIHDDLGASLTRISLLSQTVRGEVAGQPQAAADVDQIYGTARELTRAMDEIVWAVNPKHDSLDSLVTYLGGFAQNFLSTAGIRCRLDEPAHLPALALTAEIRHNVFLAFKEALHNVLKHARASEVRISLELLPGGFGLTISDNGVGFEMKGSEELNAERADVKTSSMATGNGPSRPNPVTKGSREAKDRLVAGNGLMNMRKRLEEIGGGFGLESVIGEGTRVRLVINVIKTNDKHPIGSWSIKDMT
jgi:ligand-binding sensor domain-containing protein/signal transduction histidine kinase